MTERHTPHPWITRVIAQVNEPAWLTSIDAQYSTIQYIAEYGPKGADLGTLVEVVARRLNFSIERLQTIIDLGDYREIRRALRARYARPAPRDAADSIYPHEGWLGAYLEFAQDSETPLGWHFWCAATLLGAACRNNIYLDRNIFYVTPNHYLVMVGPTSAHKSTSIGMAVDVLRQLNTTLAEHANDSREDRTILELPNKVTAEGLVDALEPKTSFKTMPGEDGSPIVRPASIGLQACEELAVLLGKNVHGSDRLVHLLTSLYGFSGKTYAFRGRLRGPVTLTHPLLSLLWGSTADWINRSVTTDFFTGGFVGRCVWVTRESSEREIPLGRPLDPVVKNALADLLAPWALCGMKEVELSAKAETWFDSWYRDNKRRKPLMPLMEGWKERKQVHLLKLALVLMISERTQPGLTTQDVERSTLVIDPRHLEKALELLTLEENRMPDTFIRIGQHTDAETTDTILATIRKLDKGDGVKHSDLLQKVRYVVGTADVLKRHISTLVESHEIELETGQGTRYRVRSSDKGTASSASSAS